MKKIILILIAVAVSAGGGLAGYSYQQKQKDDKFLSTNPQTKEAYELVKKREGQLKKDKNDYDAYMSLGFNWKGIGEVAKNDKYLWKSVKAYNAVIRKWGNKAYLPFLNQANVYISLKEYERAEDDLKIALEIDVGEQNLYIALADLYKNYMNKDNKEIKAVYEKGLKTVIGRGNLVVSYAAYLRDLGEYKEAIKYYKMLEQAYPNIPTYSSMVKDLESKIQ